MSGFYYRKRIRSRDGRSWLNVSGSGVSASQRIGNRTTVNSKGQIRVQLGKGLSWRLR